MIDGAIANTTTCSIEGTEIAYDTNRSQSCWFDDHTCNCNINPLEDIILVESNRDTSLNFTITQVVDYQHCVRVYAYLFAIGGVNLLVLLLFAFPLYYYRCFCSIIIAELYSNNYETCFYQ